MPPMNHGAAGSGGASAAWVSESVHPRTEPMQPIMATRVHQATPILERPAAAELRQLMDIAAPTSAATDQAITRLSQATLMTQVTLPRTPIRRDPPTDTKARMRMAIAWDTDGAAREWRHGARSGKAY